MKVSPQKNFLHHGMALIITLLVIVILTVCATAFMQSMSLERRTSRAYLDILRADEAAKAALEQAMGKIVSHLHRPDVGGAAYTIWGYYPNATSDAYYLAMTAGHPPDLHPSAPWLSPSNTTWLSSDSVQYSDPANQQIPTVVQFDPDNIPATSVNLNAGNRFRGLPSSLSAPWQEVIRTETQSTVGIVRFAYWIDDESSRINTAVAGNIDAPGEQHLRMFGASEKEVPLFNVTGQELADIVNSRRLLLSPSSFRELAQATGPAGDLHFLTTSFSSGLNVIQNAPAPTVGSTVPDYPYRGKRKMNLNYTGHTDSSMPAEERVARISNWIENGAPTYFAKGASNFANKSGDLASGIRRDMLKTIAASVIDYIDKDYIPTQPALPSPSDLLNPMPPVHLIRDVPRPAFFGAERCPRINEVQVVFNCDNDTYLANAVVGRSYNSGLYTYTIPVTRRFEIWNMNAESIPEAHYQIRMYNQQVISAGAFGFGGQSIPTDTDEVLDLGNLSFGPNEIKVLTVVTTFSSTGPNSLGTTWDEFWKGPDHETYPPDPGTNNDDEPRDQYNRACVLFTTRNGTDYWISSTNYMRADAGSHATYPGRTSAGPGNAGSSLGNSINDPRMSPLRSFTDGIAISASGYQNERDWASNLPGTAGQGSGSGTINNQSGASNFNFQNLDYWDARTEYNPATPRLLPEAITTVANARFRSIGELGNIFDPSWSHPRGRETATADKGYAYGSGLLSLFRGGANLRIGSPDSKAPWAANSWILTDLFGASADVSKDIDLYLPFQWSGKMNINVPKTVIANGVTFSNIELLFKLPGLAYAPPSGKGKDFDPGKLIDHIQAQRLTKNGSGGIGGQVTNWTHARPFFSTGEISEAPIWNDGALYIPEETVSATPMDAPASDGILRANRSDRGRKEIFNRSVNLLTTNSASYRVYVLGQYCEAPTGDSSKISVRATVPLEVSISATPAFDPTSGTLQGIITRKLYQIHP